jgi:hypothetical protein
MSLSCREFTTEFYVESMPQAYYLWALDIQNQLKNGVWNTRVQTGARAIWTSQVFLVWKVIPMKPISSQSDIWVKSNDQNTRGCPDGQLQPPLQDSAESFHNKAVSGRCCPSVWTVSLRLHEITIIRLGASRPWRLTSEQLNWCTQLPYMKLDRPDHEGWCLDGWTWYAYSYLIEDIVRTGSHIVRTVAAVFP